MKSFFTLILIFASILSGSLKAETPSLYSELIPFYDVNSKYIKEALEQALNIDPKGIEKVVLLNNPVRDNPQGAGSSGEGNQSVVVGAPTVDEGASSDYKRLGGEVLVNLLTAERVELARKIIRTIDYPRNIIDIEFVLVSIDKQILNESGITLDAMLESFQSSPKEIAKTIAASATPGAALDHSDISSTTLGVGTLHTAVQHTFNKLRAKIAGNLTSRKLRDFVTVMKTINLPVSEGLKADYTLETKDIIVTQSAFGTGSVSMSGGITLSVRPIIDQVRTEQPKIVIDFLYSNGSINNNSTDQNQLPRVTRLEHKQSLSVVPGEITPLSSLVSSSDENSEMGFEFLTFIPVGQKNLKTESKLDLILLLRANIRKEGQISLPQLLLDQPSLREELLGQEIIQNGYSAILNPNLTKADVMHRLSLTALNAKNRERYQAPLLLEVTETNEALGNTVMQVRLCTHSVLSAIFTIGIRTKPTCWNKKVTLKDLGTQGLTIDYELTDNEHYYLYVNDASHHDPVKDPALIKFAWQKDANIIEQLNEATYGHVLNED